MGVEEGAEEGVEVVRAGGEIEPIGVQEGLNVSIERGHAGDGGGVVNEGGAEGADWGGGHSCFDGIVNV